MSTNPNAAAAEFQDYLASLAPGAGACVTEEELDQLPFKIAAYPGEPIELAAREGA